MERTPGRGGSARVERGEGMKSREEVLQKIEGLAAGRVNDAIRLAFLKDGELEELAKLDLSVVTEFKRSSNGTVEIKFVDRLAALQWLLEQVGENPKAERLYEALEKGTEK